MAADMYDVRPPALIKRFATNTRLLLEIHRSRPQKLGVAQVNERLRYAQHPPRRGAEGRALRLEPEPPANFPLFRKNAMGISAEPGTPGALHDVTEFADVFAGWRS
jgi:hypothetical protein